MNVCFLSQAFVRYPADVIGSFIFRLAQGLQAHGVNVTVVAPHAAGLATTETLDGIHVRRFHYAPARYERLAYQGRMHELIKENPLNGLLLVTFLIGFAVDAVRTIRSQNSELIQAHWWFPSGMAGAIASAVTGVPLVITCHGTDIALLQRSPKLCPVARLVFGRAAAVTVVSDYLRQELQDQLCDLRIPISVIAMPIDRAFTAMGEGPQSHHSSRRNILAVGRLTRQKGFDQLLAASQILVQRGLDIGVTFIGEGDEEAHLRKETQDLGLQDRVVFLGFRPPSELVGHYRAADVLALPSLDEGLGLTLVEAMFCGVPVVGTRSGGIGSLIADGETGLLVAPGSAVDLADALEKVLTDPIYAQRLASAGQQYVRRDYDPDALVRQTLDIYQHTAEAHA